jgi:excisionase family DNA binding protein
MSTQKFYTVKEVAALLRVNERTVLNLIDRGELKANRVGSLWRISQEALDEYLQRHS